MRSCECACEELLVAAAMIVIVEDGTESEFGKMKKIVKYEEKNLSSYYI